MYLYQLSVKNPNAKYWQQGTDAATSENEKFMSELLAPHVRIVIVSEYANTETTKQLW